MARTALLGTIVLALWLAAPAQAVQRNWKDGVTGDWNDPANWMNGIPGPADVAYLGKTNDGHVVTLKGSGATVAVVYGGSKLIVDGVSLTVTGSTAPDDITSLENAFAINNGAVSFTGPGRYQGGLTLAPGTALTISGAGVKWSGAVLGAPVGSGTTTITPTGDVTVEPFTTLNIRTRFQNRGKLHTDVLTELVPSPGSLPSDGDFEASATGTFSLRPGPDSTFTLDKDSSVTGPGRFEMSDLVEGAGRIVVDSGANFAPGVVGLFGAERFELNTNATIGKLELHFARGTGGRFGTGELHATGDSLLLGTHLGGGRTVFDGPLLIQSGDASFLTDGAVMRTTGTTTWLQGAVDLTSGAWENAGTINVSNGILSGPGVLKNSGTINKTGATGLLGSGPLENTGTITVAAGRFGSDVPTGTYGTLVQSSGLINVMSGAVLDKIVILDGGILKGRGTVRWVTNNGGTIEPGASPGTLNIAGSFLQGTDGVLRMEIEGPSAYDVLAVGGAASVGGTLELIGGYTPAAGDALGILTVGGAFQGPFATVTGSAAGRFAVGYAASGITLCQAGTATCGGATPTPTASPTVTASPTATASATATASPSATASPTATATAIPQPTVAPVPTAAPTPTPKPLTAADLVTLPSATRCVSRRTLTLRLRHPAGVRIAKATARVDGKRAKPFTGTITLRGLPKGRYTVKVAVKLSDGRSFTVSRRYRTCAPKSRSESSHNRSLLSGSSA